jgi:hypothetical protein
MLYLILCPENRQSVNFGGVLFRANWDALLLLNLPALAILLLVLLQMRVGDLQSSLAKSK